jgi:peptidoglycan/xylan/chitin deacetylase (PgdA/CDA1 family)
MISPSYIKASNSTYEIYKQLQQGKRILPNNYEQKDYLTPLQPTVYLTFDDGPSIQTPKILDILQKEGIKASFFVLGIMAEEHPEWVKRVVNEGHALGNHTYNHNYKKLYGDAGEFWRQIQLTEKILYSICGLKPELVRAPGGTYTNFNAFYYYDMDEAGYTVMDWNMDSADSTRANISAREIVDKVKQSTLKHDVNLLMHDGSGHGQTVQALPEIIQYFKKRGYAFAPLTSNVKPIQFPLAIRRFNQTYSYAQFNLQEERNLEHAAERQKEITEAVQKAEELRVLALRPKIPLRVSYNNEEQIIQPEEYAYRDNKIYVPLEELAAVMGANLVWNNLEHRVTAYYGQRKIEYNLDKHTLVAFEPNGLPTTYGLQTYVIRDGRLEVPLRSTVEGLGNYIGAYQKLDNELNVQVNQGYASQIIMDCSGIYSSPIDGNVLLQG